jgi:hypothetical protein
VYINMSKEKIPDKCFERFWSRVRKTKGCWHWNGSKNKSGYGRFRIEDKVFLAHRISYLIYFENIPDDKIVLHTCDNPGCVNPKHLMLGTKGDNTRDCILKNRNCHGSNIWCAKLNEIQVKYIRQHKEIMASEIAKELKVSKATIYRIRNYKIWKNPK